MEFEPNAKEYVQLMERQQWTIIYRWFGRSRTSETWPVLFPALVPVKSSFMQMKYQRKGSEWLGVWKNCTVPFYSWGQIFDGHSEIVAISSHSSGRLGLSQTPSKAERERGPWLGNKGSKFPRWSATSSTPWQETKAWQLLALTRGHTADGQTQQGQGLLMTIHTLADQSTILCVFKLASPR